MIDALFHAFGLKVLSKTVLVYEHVLLVVPRYEWRWSVEKLAKYIDMRGFK